MFFSPFHLRMGGNETFKLPGMQETMYQNSCRESYSYQMENLQNFIDAYPDKPKFSLTWMTNLAHDFDNNLYHVDDYFYQFFKQNKEKVKKRNL